MAKTEPLRKWGWALLGAAPFLSCYLVHFLYYGRYATGFIQYDQAYYGAVGRAFFTAGNVLGSPNPYDPDPASPVIYHQWLPWLLGLAAKVLRLDPGLFYALLGIVSGLACARLTLSLVEKRLAGHGERVLPLFLLGMWGGGFLAAGSLLRFLLQGGWGRWSELDVLSLDPMKGMFFLNWGRNLLYTTESVYHLLFAGLWLAVLGRRWKTALLLALLLAQTHPWTGLPALAVLCLWAGASRMLKGAEPVPAWLLAAAPAGTAACLWYYMIYLHRFPAHHAMELRWEAFAFSVSGARLMLAYAPVAAAALVHARARRWRLESFEWFLAACFAVTFVLSKHDWFMRPIQPLHFTRGYSWMALYLLGLPAWDDALRRAEKARGAAVKAAALAAGLLMVSDNIAFLAVHSANRYADCVPLWLAPDDRGLFASMVERRLNGVVLFSDTRMDYLSAVYTDARPFVGHYVLTPDYLWRCTQAYQWLEGGPIGPDIASIDLVGVRADQVPKRLSPPAWREISSNATWRLFARNR